jgi:O-antigen ligase
VPDPHCIAVPLRDEGGETRIRPPRRRGHAPNGGAPVFLRSCRRIMSAASRARPVFEVGLDLCAFLFLPILVLASRGAAPLLTVAGICALGLVIPVSTVSWRRVRWLALMFGALVVWGLVSSLWAIEPRRSLVTALRLAGMFAAGLALIAAAEKIASPHRVLRCLMAGFALALALSLAQFATHGALTAPFYDRQFIGAVLNQAEDGFAFLILPVGAALLLQRRRVLAGALVVVTLGAICILVGETVRTAFLLGLATAVMLYHWRGSLTRAAAALSIVLIVGAPLLFPPLVRIDVVEEATRHMTKNSLRHRLEIWSFVGDRIAEKPLLGWGLDSSRAIPGGNQPIPGGYPGQVMLPLHPHNAPLQLWLELGAPGALLFAVFVARVWLALGTASWPRLYAAAAGGSVVTALVVALASYGTWQEWFISSEFLTLFLIIVMARTVRPMPEARSGPIP